MFLLEFIFPPILDPIIFEEFYMLLLLAVAIQTLMTKVITGSDCETFVKFVPFEVLLVLQLFLYVLVPLKEPSKMIRQIRALTYCVRILWS